MAYLDRFCVTDFLCPSAEAIVMQVSEVGRLPVDCLSHLHSIHGANLSLNGLIGCTSAALANA